MDTVGNEEILLQGILDGDTETNIEPAGNEEILLKGILEGDTETSIDPANRKERLLKAILEKGGASAQLKAVVGKTLTSITADELDGVTSVGAYAFYSCRSLTFASLPDSVTSIGSSAFAADNALEEVHIGSGITSIGSNCFLNDSALVKLTIDAETPPTLSNANAFSGTNANLVIYVPADSVDAYKAASNWSVYADQIQAIEGE